MKRWQTGSQEGLCREGKVGALAATYRLDEITKAYGRVEKGQVRFRAVVTNQ